MDHLSGLSWAIVRRRRHLDHWLLKLLELLPWHLTSSWNCHHILMEINAELGTNIRITQHFIGLPFTWTQILCLILLSHRLYWQLQSNILVFSCCVILFVYCILLCKPYIPSIRGRYSVPWSNCISTNTMSEGSSRKSEGGAVMM